MIKMKMTRTYTMRARAANMEATRRRIADVVVAMLKVRFRSEVRLADVARDSEVSVQTVLNVFGNRAALLDEALADLLREVRAQRLQAQPGDDLGAIAALVEHYERFGDWVIRNLAENADTELLELGRTGHREWVARQFGLALSKVEGKQRQAIIDQLVCVCDVYSWKLLRRDMGRSRARTEATIVAMVRAILGAHSDGTIYSP
jgi:AcrR family transcriptional regulator